MSIQLYIFTYICTHTRVRTHMNVYIYVHTNTYAYVHASIRICKHYAHIHTHARTYITHAYIHKTRERVVCVSARVCTHACACKLTFKLRGRRIKLFLKKNIYIYNYNLMRNIYRNKAIFWLFLQMLFFFSFIVWNTIVIILKWLLID